MEFSISRYRFAHYFRISVLGGTRAAFD
jgi:hypothetical protein